MVRGWVKVFCSEKVKEHLHIHRIKFDPQILIFHSQPSKYLLQSCFQLCVSYEIMCVSLIFTFCSSKSVLISLWLNMFSTTHASCLILILDDYFHFCVPQLFLLLTWVQQLYASPPFNLSLLHIVHVLLPLCVLSLCDLVLSFSSFSPHPSFNSCHLPLSILLLLFPLFCSSPLTLYPSVLLYLFVLPLLFLICVNPLSFWAFSFPAFVLSLSLAVRLASRVSEPVVVCAVHPPASHSAPSFLRQYAGHLGRTALRREPGGGLERDRAYLSLHRTGSLGTHTHTLTHIYSHLHSDACTHP